MRILITGASGFIGGNMVKYLASNPLYHIIASGRSDTAKFEQYNNVEYLKWDLSRQTKEIQCDICIHCAGLADDRSTEQQLFLHNIKATENLLKSVQNCKQLIFISSSSVYDFSDGKIKTEEDANLNNNLSLYGRSKLLAENIVTLSGISSVYILRPRAVYGKGDRVLLPRILQLIKNNRLIVPGSLQVTGSLTHIQNLCEAVAKAVEHQNQGIYIYNIADKKPYLMKTVFSEILLNKTGGKLFIHVPVRIIKFFILINKILRRTSQLSLQSLNYLTQHEVLNTEKAEREMRYKSEHEFYASIEELISK